MDVLSDIVDLVKLRGVIYFDAEFRPPWGVTVPAFARVARYHFVTRGRCWISVAGVREPRLLEAGDLVVVPHGAEHILRDEPRTQPKTLDHVLAASGYQGRGCLVYGRGDRGSPARLVCGHFEFDRELSHPLLKSLPPLIHVPATTGADYSWLDDALRYIAAEVSADRPGSAAIVKRLSEIVFVQTVRAARDSSDPALRSLAGYSDPHISRALAALHHAPDRTWTVASLAHEAGLSRTRFAARFRDALGVAPLAYAAQWRMEQARQLIAASARTILDIANHVGYASEAAFSRAYTKHFGVPPGQHRARAVATATSATRPKVQLKRVYEPTAPTDGFRILIDRLWPRGLTKQAANVAQWHKDVAPTTVLRRWFDHEPSRWPEFKRRYTRELAANSPAVEALRAAIDRGPATLLYAAQGPYHHGVVLVDYLRRAPRSR
jgi:AraC family transcriptional activator of mtrCDE